MKAAIDRYMPEWDARERHRTFVRAPPEQVFTALKRVDVSRSWAISSLSWLRELPARIAGRRGRRLRIDLEAFQRSGFVLLEEREGEEIVFGLVGKFWRPKGNIRRVSPEEFIAFDSPGYARAAFNFRLRGTNAGTTLSTETRIHCTDPDSRKRFRIYWTLIGPFSGLIRREMLRLVKREAESYDGT